MKNKIILFLITLFALPAVSDPFIYKKGTASTFFEGRYYYSKGNFSSTGVGYNLQTDNQISEYASFFGGSYDPINRLQVFSDFGFKRVRSLGLPVERTNTGFSEWGIGARGDVYNGFIKLIPELSFSLPLHEAEPDNALLDDGAMKFTGKVYFVKHFFKSALVAGHLGYQYLSEGLSSRIPYGLFFRHDVGRLFYSFGIKGYESMKSDSKSEGQRFFVINNLNAGSYRYRYYNPSSTEGFVRAGYDLDSHFEVFSGGSYTFAGQNSAVGFAVWLGLSYTWNAGAIEIKKTKSDGFKPFVSEPEKEIMRDN